MLYQVIIIIGLLGFLTNLILNLRSLKVPSIRSVVPEPAPLVSVLIPARDEENNIAICLETLRKQDYPNFEVLVLDDGSIDRTAEIVGRIAADDNRIQLIEGELLPDDWAGKPFACYQLARKARGSWLLFVDADTRHAPHMIRGMLDLAIRYRTSLLSGFPCQLAHSLPQKVAIPVLYFVILGWLPLWWLQRSGKPRPSLAIGQFLLFPADEYWSIGGHRAVKSRILEDVWLGVEINRHGGRHMAVDLSPVVSCSMYRSIGGMWEGFVKWMYSVMAISPMALFGLLIAGYIFYLAPFYWLWNEFFVIGAPTAWRELIVVQVLIILFMRGLIDMRFKEPAISLLLHPIGFSFLYISCLYACGRRIVGAGVSWKKRLYEGHQL